MKPTDIAKIRHILKELKYCEENHLIFNFGNKVISLAEINEALALLPCETCGGTGDSKASVIDDLSGGIVDTDIPCPDCQPKSKDACGKCPACGEYHPTSTICPPPEVRMI